VTEFITSVVLFYHLVAVMWLSYVQRSYHICQTFSACDRYVLSNPANRQTGNTVPLAEA